MCLQVTSAIPTMLTFTVFSSLLITPSNIVSTHWSIAYGSTANQIMQSVLICAIVVGALPD
jgi:hypothetical protein